MAEEITQKPNPYAECREMIRALRAKNQPNQIQPKQTKPNQMQEKDTHTFYRHLENRVADYEKAYTERLRELNQALDALECMADQYLSVGYLPDGRHKYDHYHMCAGEDCLDVLEYHKRVGVDQSKF